MDQRSTAGAHAVGTVSMTGATTEFEPDVMDLLVEALRGAVRRELPVVGTENVLAALVMGDTEAGAAIAPGMRAAGGLSGLISGRAGRGWGNDDESGAAPVSADAAGRTGAGADALEVDRAWREAVWRLGLRSRGSASSSDRARPGMTGALRTGLLLAIASARAEETISVRCRHVARALVDLPCGRAREALLLRGLDPAAVAAALDAPAVGAHGPGGAPESRGVTLLRRAGVLGRSGNVLTRAITSWTSGAAQNGSPVLFAVSVEAVRQAVRCGRSTAEPVDLLLAILALDRALAVAGRSLPEHLAATDTAPALLRRHGVRQDSLARAAAAPAPVPGPATDTDTDATDARAVTSTASVQLSAASDRAMAAARLIAAEHGSPYVGTVHLLAALLHGPSAKADADGILRLLRASGPVDVAALRAELRERPDA